MNIQYVEIYRGEERVYQGVALGDKDAMRQIDQITKDAKENGQRLRQTSPQSWCILSNKSDARWGKVFLRPF